MCVTTSLFFFSATAPTEIYTLSLHDALPISVLAVRGRTRAEDRRAHPHRGRAFLDRHLEVPGQDRKSTRLNSSHVRISYAVFCLKKKIKTHRLIIPLHITLITYTLQL